MTLLNARRACSRFRQDGIVEFSRELRQLGFELLSTGARHERWRQPAFRRHSRGRNGRSRNHGRRVKTLHPRVHGALLGRTGKDDAAMREHGIRPIDVLVVNLYPFRRDSPAPRLQRCRCDR